MKSFILTLNSPRQVITKGRQLHSRIMKTLFTHIDVSGGDREVKINPQIVIKVPVVAANLAEKKNKDAAESLHSGC